MSLWLDAQLPPSLAGWISLRFGIEATAVRDLNLREAEDEEIFEAATRAQAIVMTKDADFAQLLERHGPPPQVIWLRCGNTSNRSLRRLLLATLADALALLASGESLVEIADAWSVVHRAPGTT